MLIYQRALCSAPCNRKYDFKATIVLPKWTTYEKEHDYCDRKNGLLSAMQGGILPW